MNFDDVDLAIIVIGAIVGVAIWQLNLTSNEIIVGGITAIAALARGKPASGISAPPPAKPPETT